MKKNRSALTYDKLEETLHLLDEYSSEIVSGNIPDKNETYKRILEAVSFLKGVKQLFHICAGCRKKIALDEPFIHGWEDEEYYHEKCRQIY